MGRAVLQVGLTGVVYLGCTHWKEREYVMLAYRLVSYLCIYSSILGYVVY